MLIFTDRDGNEVDLVTWARLMDDKDYCCLGFWLVHDRADSRSIVVSTVWLGTPRLRHTPIILLGDFETALWADPGCNFHPAVNRYMTLAEAWRGHLAVVDEVAAQMGDPVVFTDGQPPPIV